VEADATFDPRTLRVGLASKDEALARLRTVFDL
jgi:hypothetical protein